MEILNNLGQGFADIFSIEALVPMLIGVFVGSLVGAIPGVGPVGAMAVLLPLSFTFEPTSGILMLAAIYIGAMYGNSTSSILLRMPGDPAGVITSLDGHEMTKKGRAGAALALAAIGSFTAGTIAVALLMLAAGPLSAFAISFAAPEYLALTIFAVFVLSRLAGGTMAGTMVAASLGIMLATIGLDESSGNVRFTFGFDPLVQGLEVTPVAVGIFGIAEVLRLAEQRGELPNLPRVRFRELYPNRSEFRRAVPPIFRGGVLGFLFGLMPGPSGPVSTYASYMLERRISKRSDEFGKGAPEGVAGPEAANNGAAGGGMIPLLILGVPFSAPLALLLAGFTIHGVTPGPLFLENDPQVFWGLIAGMYAANVFLLILNLPLVGIFTTILRVPRDMLLTSIIVIAVIGTYATRNSMVDVAWLMLMGVLGYVMIKLGLPRVALMLTFVIATLMEQSLTQTLSLADGNVAYILGRPISLVILGVTMLILVAPTVFKRLNGRQLGTSFSANKDGDG